MATSTSTPTPTPTPLSAATPSNPSNLPPRYEIRRLTPADLLPAIAIQAHSNIYHSAVYGIKDPSQQAPAFGAMLTAGSTLVSHQIKSGLSLGVFDLSYEYKRPESAAEGGKFYWEDGDPGNATLTREEILERMDFPLVSIALAYDTWDVLPEHAFPALTAVLPTLGAAVPLARGRDKRDPASWQATGPRQVLQRYGSSTRREYEGRGLMAAMARFMMRDAKEKGFRGIGVGSPSAAVKHVWGNPPAPFRATVVSRVGTREVKDENGVCPYGDVDEEIVRIWVDL